ncbi:response regulator [Salipiger mucosus]|uniref:Sensor histidine kinase/response regulator n=1 Tax=Salipiger mucosus DSM 16094 TaxID=1123237 RepID=S9QR92_9RHOB|nr:response regulator [Salipiger mucosus]EPX82162.1 sensor histidine kinase/response regulator [Salipiger mucosus DSM 16094]
MATLTQQAIAEPDLPDVHRLVTLVLEDDEIDRRRLVKLTRRAGLDAEFHMAQDLAQLQRQLDARRFDLFFVDYHLGMATGQEALDLIETHEEQRGAVSIMVTSVDRPEVIIEAMRTGCSDYLIKEELSAETIRRSVVAALEKLILASAHDTERARDAALRQTLLRFRDSMEPELRRIMSAMLRRVREIGRLSEGERVQIQRHAMEQLCLEMISLLDRSENLIGPDQRSGRFPS